MIYVDNVIPHIVVSLCVVIGFVCVGILVLYVIFQEFKQEKK